MADFIHRLHDHVYETKAERLRSVLGKLPAGPVPIEMVLQFIASAYVGLLHWWLHVLSGCIVAEAHSHTRRAGEARAVMRHQKNVAHSELVVKGF